MPEALNASTIPFIEIIKEDYFKAWYSRWLRNELENWPTIYGDFKRGNACISALPKVNREPALIIGSGPSLDYAAPFLKNWEGCIFASATNALLLLDHGVSPEYVHVYDSNPKNAWRLKYPGYDKKSNMITHPNVARQILQAWGGRRWYFLRRFPGHEHFQFIQPLQYINIYKDRSIGLTFDFVASVVNNQIQVALYLGYSPLFLIGVDIGWKDPNHTRCQEYAVKNGKLIKAHTMTQKDYKETLYAWHEYTYAESNIRFKTRLMLAIANDKFQAIDCSDGMIQELKKADIKEVIKNQGKGYDYTLDEIRVMGKKIHDYLGEAQQLEEAKKHGQGKDK